MEAINTNNNNNISYALEYTTGLCIKKLTMQNSILYLLQLNIIYKFINYAVSIKTNNSKNIFIKTKPDAQYKTILSNIQNKTEQTKTSG